MNRVRAEKYAEAKALGYELVSYVSSRCTFLTQHPPGDNCFILEDNTVQPFVRIGNNVTLWSGNHIGHDSVDRRPLLHQLARRRLGPRARSGSDCFIGVNATLRNTITIARAHADRRRRADHEEHGAAVGLPRRRAPSGSPRPATRWICEPMPWVKRGLIFAPAGQAAVDRHPRRAAGRPSRWRRSPPRLLQLARRRGPRRTSATSTLSLEQPLICSRSSPRARASPARSARSTMPA